jgi:hypothetical protein
MSMVAYNREMLLLGQARSGAWNWLGASWRDAQDEPEAMTPSPD